jgi:hypothetical protein
MMQLLVKSVELVSIAQKQVQSLFSNNYEPRGKNLKSQAGHQKVLT